MLKWVFSGDSRANTLSSAYAQAQAKVKKLIKMGDKVEIPTKHFKSEFVKFQGKDCVV